MTSLLHYLTLPYLHLPVRTKINSRHTALLCCRLTSLASSLGWLVGNNIIIDDEGRYILLEMTIQESPFLLLNSYVPTKLNEQIVFFQEILSAVQSANFDTECRVIIGGDFNVHLDADLDNSGGQIETKSTVKNIQDIMLEYNLIDIWRLRNPDKRQFTWSNRNPIMQRRIDFWLISDDLKFI